MKENHTVLVGDKNFMNYVTAVIMQFTTEKAKEVIIKARGKFTSKAIDVSEAATKRFLDNEVKLKNIEIGSEEFENREGKQVRVSTIEIILKIKK